jgi:HEPN domain-containing protein
MFIASIILDATKTKAGMLSLGISFSILFGGLTVVIALRITKAIMEKDKINRENKYAKAGYSFRQRSQMLFSDGYYDLSVIEAFKALELILKKTLLYGNVFAERKTLISLIEQSRKLGLITSDKADNLNRFRLIRNRLVHGEGTITETEAAEIMEYIKLISSNLDDSENSQRSPIACNW